jgi:phage gp37-like protein
MAVYNFAQRAIILQDRGMPEVLTATNANCSPLALLNVAVYKVVADVLKGDLTISTSINGEPYPTLTSRGVTAPQLLQFVRNVRDEQQYRLSFLQAVMDEPGYINADTDNKLNTCVRKTIWFYAKDITI